MENKLSGEWAKAFGTSHEQFVALFSKMPSALAYCKIVTDENSKPVDFIFLDVNEAYEKLQKLRREDIVDKKATEVFNIRIDIFELINLCGHVALSGEPMEIEDIENVWVDGLTFQLLVQRKITSSYFLKT